MRLLFCFLAFFLLSGCTHKKTVKPSDNAYLSKTQIGIEKLIDSFKTEYNKSETTVLRESVTNKYNQKFSDYLSNNSMDSFRVYVDTVMNIDSTITTKFHYGKEVAFQFGLTFKKPETDFFDSLFLFMNGLKPGTDTTVNFDYMTHQLNDPNDTNLPTLKIFAIPRFLSKAN